MIEDEIHNLKNQNDRLKTQLMLELKDDEKLLELEEERINNQRFREIDELLNVNLEDNHEEIFDDDGEHECMKWDIGNIDDENYNNDNNIDKIKDINDINVDDVIVEENDNIVEENDNIVEENDNSDDMTDKLDFN